MPEQTPPELQRLFRRFEPLPDRIERNQRRVWVFLVAYTALSSFLTSFALVSGPYLTLLVIALRGRSYELVDALVWFTVRFPVIVLVVWVVTAPLFALWCVATLRRAEFGVLARLGAIPVPTGEQRKLKAALDDVCIASGMRLPCLTIIPDDSLNAFVVSHRDDRGWVGVTSGLADQLTPDEIRFVFAHLIARIQDGSARTATILAELFDASASAGRVCDGIVTASCDEVDDSLSTAMLKTAVSPVALLLAITRWCLSLTGLVVLSGYREQQLLNAECADAAGLMFTRDPAGMMSALRKVLPADNRPGTVFEPRFRDDILGGLFFAWPTYSMADDNELVRIQRLREVLGPAAI